MSNIQYWATKPQAEIIDDLMKKVSSYDDFLVSSGIMGELRDSYKTFYGDSQVRDAGQQGELKSIRVNHYASLIRNLVSLVTTNKPAWQPIASNTDSTSQATSILAAGLLDFYMKDRRLDRVFRNACQMACFLKESWVATTWDTQAGEVVAVDQEVNTAVHEGDLKFQTFQLNDVIRDYTKTNSTFDWLITREYVNKWDLIAQFPEYEEQIKAFTITPVDAAKVRLSYFSGKEQNQNDDQISFFTFYFKPCAALPNGRMITFIDGQVLTDDSLPYAKIPLVRISAEDTFESAFSHSPMMDVLPLQKAIDTMASILLTNNEAFGVQSILVPNGSEISVSQISTGMNVINFDQKLGPPQPMQLTASAPEAYKFFDVLIQQSQLLSGINDAVRGQAAAGASGASLALLSQQAIQFANGLQQGWVSLVEDTGTLAIQTLQRYAHTKRVAVLTGKHNSPLLKEWSGADLNGISRISIESGNALAKTASGRLTMADSLMERGMLERPEQYISVMTTGQLEPIYENEQAQLMLIRKENERLAEGKTARALLTHDHQNHILEHASVLANPDLLDNPDSPVVQNTLAHIQEHLQLAQSMPPALAMLLKQQPLPQAPMPPQGSPGPQQAQSAIPQTMDGTNSVTTAAGEVNGPNFPKNPATGETFNPSNQ